MKFYRIQECDGQWQMTIDGHARPMFMAADRDSLIELASKVAGEHDSRVSAYDEVQSVVIEIRFQDGQIIKICKDR